MVSIMLKQEIFEIWGYIAHEFAEIIMEIKHPSYFCISVDGEFSKISDLRFIIGNVEIRLSPVSAMFKLLFNGDIDSDYTNIDMYLSLKLLGISPENFKFYTQSALYYINSHYLGKTGCFAEIVNLDSTLLDYFWEKGPEDIAKKLVRTRNRKRTERCDTIPLQLFNYACSAKGTESFLLLQDFCVLF